MAGEVSCKAYLIRENGEKSEIRRFSLDENVATSFIYLKEKLRATFPPISLSQTFDIFWKDREGDNVTICSDDELMIAVTESKDQDVLKIYVKNKTAPAPASVNTTKGPSHNGITCDGCDCQIFGYRYKCLGCHDYDLCAACESKGIHSEHFTLRIPTPLNTRHHFGNRLINKVSKAARKAESRCPWSHRRGPQHNLYENLAEDFTANCSTEGPPGYWRENFKNVPKARSDCTEGPPGYWREELKNAAKAMHPDPKEYGKAESCVDPKESDNGCMGCSAASGTPPGPFRPIVIDPLQIPNAICSTLADFGIDLSAFLAPPQSTSNTEEAAKKSNSAAENNSQATGESSAAKIPKMSTTTPSTPAAKESNTTAPKDPNTPANDVEPKRSSLLDEWTVYNPNDPIEIDLEPVEVTMPSSESSVPSEKEKAANGAPIAQSEPSTSNANLYPSLAGLPKNKKVADALDQMIAMGFKNDDGWLTNLLNLQDGNIAKVLDLIQPAALKK